MEMPVLGASRREEVICAAAIVARSYAETRSQRGFVVAFGVC
jgi:hypothetical protein